jgi:hypothetical protein
VSLNPIIKKNDPSFNSEVAKKTYDFFMKMDEEDACALAYLVASDILEQDIEKNLGTLQRRVNQIVEKRMVDLKSATARIALKDPDKALPFAKALSEISKENPYDYGYRFREADFNRDPATGRFRAKVVTSQVKPIHDKTAASMGLPTAEQAVKAASTTKLGPARRAAYQDQYRQLVNFLGAVNASGQPGDRDVIAHIKPKRGQEYTIAVNSTNPKSVVWDPATEDLVGLDARPNALTAGGAYFGLATALGSPGTAQFNRGATRTASELDQRFSGFAQDWSKPSEATVYNSNDRLYNRISTGSSLVGEIAPPGSKAQVAARMAQFVGDHGSDAEAVFGPSARKAAYRYRGTSKEPDKQLTTIYDRAVSQSKISSRHRDNMSNTQMAAARVAADRAKPTNEELGNGRAVVEEYLRRRMPKPALYNLQLASGNTPPSEGVLIDKNGKIIDQAVGYGGEYIRTRSVGGPTTEDIYTGLMSGARKVTVVSRSGTFTVDFHEDFKGGRRYNDKARRMVGRYANILDAVQSEQVDRQSLAPDIRNAIRSEVIEEAGGYARPDELSAAIRQREQEFKSNPELSVADERLARFMATQRASGTQGKDADDYMAQVMNELASEKEYKFRLNGVGYSAALTALQEQFPYYITANSAPRREQERLELEMDRGYVSPGRNRPAYAAAGHFGVRNLTPYRSGGKFSAQEANYQGGSRGSGGGGGGEPTPPAPGLSPTGDNKPSVATAIAEQAAARKWTAAAVNLQNAMRGRDRDLPPEEKRLINLSPEELTKPENQSAFDRLAQQYVSQLGLDGAKYLEASGMIGRTKYEPEMSGIWGPKPYQFEGEAYEPGAPAVAVRKALAEVDRKTLSGIVVNKPLSEMNPDELTHEFNVTSQIAPYLELGVGGNLEDRKRLMNSLDVKAEAPGFRQLLDHPTTVNTRLESLHRARSLKANMPGLQEKPPEDITLHVARTPEDEKKGPQGRVTQTQDSIERAAKNLEKQSPSPERDNDLDTLYTAAQALHEAHPQVRSHTDADELLIKGGGHPANELIQNAIDIAMRAHFDAGAKTEPEKRSGSILS